MKVRAVAKIKIETTPELTRTFNVYKQGLQFCVNQSWKRKIKNNVRLHPFVYRSLRKRGLQSQLAIACIKQACGIVKKAKSKPIIKKASIRYNFPRSASFKHNILSISTIKGRRKFKITIPKCYKQYFEWNLRESLLMRDRKGRIFFCFTFSKDININSSDLQSRAIGIDVGMNNLAVTSDRKFYGKGIKQLRVKRDRMVSQLQSKGTKSARRKLKRLSGSWKRFMAWTNHNISSDIIRCIGAGDVVVMEDIKHIRRDSKNKWVHKWAFNQLQRFIEYKVLRKGFRVVYIDPEYTSKECSIYHNRFTSRHSGFFQCLVCGHSLNSDLNASYNIAQRYMRTMCLGSVTNPNVSDCDAKTSCDGLRRSSGTNSQEKISHLKYT